MKMRKNWLLVSAVVLGLGACSKKEEVKAPAAAPPAVESPVPAEPAAPAAPGVVTPAPEEVAVPAVAALSVEQRAAKLGFAQHLPQDTEVVMAFHNGKKSVDRVTASKLWKFLQEQSGDGMGGELDGLPPMEAPDDEEFQLPGDEATDLSGPAPLPDAGRDLDGADGALEGAALPPGVEADGPGDLFGSEFTIAMGKTAGEQGANMVTAYRRMGYMHMRGLAKSFAAAAKTGEFSGIEDSMDSPFGGPELFKDLLADPQSGVALVERLKMPPLYLAFRTSEEGRSGAAQQLAGLIENLGMFGDMVEPIEVETAGQKFVGLKISGAKIAANMEDSRADMEGLLEPAAVDRLFAAIAKKDLVVVSGTLGNYAMLFIGSSVEDLKLAATPGQSLVASEALSFGDAYADKELAAVIYGQKEAMDQLVAASGGLADMANGLRDGLAGAEGMGDTRDLEALLRMVGEREAALLKLTVSDDSTGMVAFFEDGLKIESYGGTDNGMTDWKSPNKLAMLGDAPDVVMFANLTVEAAYDEKARAYMEALLETGYALAMKASELKVEDEDFEQFKASVTLFDAKFRPEVVALWDAFSGDFSESLGHECAYVVDLKGAVPALPGIPQPMIDGGKFPRISVLAPVTDRAKLAASWQKMNVNITSALAKVSEVIGTQIPMQKPISSEKNGYTTWFFSLPFFSDDFMPSVTVDDKWFVASTSKNQALDLVSQAATGGTTRNGLYFALHFQALQKFARETLKLVEQNSAAIFGEEDVPTEDMAKARQLIDAMDDLDRLTVHARREGGKLRSSIHFKTR